MTEPETSKGIRILRGALGALLLVAALLASGTRPDLDPAELERRYAPPPSRFMEVEGLRVHYRDEGQGEPIVLIHGTSSSLHTWDAWARHMRDSRRVVRLDLPGFGLTGPAPDRDYRAVRYARVVAAVAHRLGLERYDVAGNSLGGRVALELTLMRPERIRRLVLVDAAGLSGQAPPPIFRLARTPVVNQLLTFITPTMLVRKNVREVYGNPELVDDALVRRYADLLRREGNREALVDRLTGPRDDDLDGRLREIRQRTLILWGARDIWIPESFGHRLDEGIPDSTLRVYPELGHVPMEEAGDLTAREAEAFLAAP